MNEILRAKRLTEEILARAAAIKEHMLDINERMHRMEHPTKQEAEKLPSAPQLQLLDLPDDLLSNVSKSLESYNSLIAMSRVCTRLRSIVNNDDQAWELMCREDWGVAEPDACAVPCLNSILLRTAPGEESPEGQPRTAAMKAALSSLGGGADTVCSRAMLASLVATTSNTGGRLCSAAASSGGFSPRSSAGVPQGQRSLRGASKSSPWRNIYRDRIQGWGMVRSVLTWLATHDCPRNLTGSMHRLQLNLALRYMELGTLHPQDAPRRQEVLERSGLKSLLALLDNNSAGVQEIALSVLANLISGDAETKMQVLLGSRMGKLMCDKLDANKTPGVVQQASRALVNLWAEAPVPEVVPLLPDNQPARAQLRPGQWVIQEYSLRGENFSLLHVQLSFDPATGAVHGGGYDLLGDNLEEFLVSGRRSTESGNWSLQRTFLHVHNTVLYSGYSDLHGAWGVYKTQHIHEAAAAMFSVSSGSRQPRVFRLFRDESIQPDNAWQDPALQGLHLQRGPASAQAGAAELTGTAEGDVAGHAGILYDPALQGPHQQSGSGAAGQAGAFRGDVTGPAEAVHGGDSAPVPASADEYASKEMAFPAEADGSEATAMALTEVCETTALVQTEDLQAAAGTEQARSEAEHDVQHVVPTEGLLAGSQTASCAVLDLSAASGYAASGCAASCSVGDVLCDSTPAVAEPVGRGLAELAPVALKSCIEEVTHVVATVSMLEAAQLAPIALDGSPPSVAASPPLETTQLAPAAGEGCTKEPPPTVANASLREATQEPDAKCQSRLIQRLAVATSVLTPWLVLLVIKRWKQ